MKEMGFEFDSFPDILIMQ